MSLTFIFLASPSIHTMLLTMDVYSAVSYPLGLYSDDQLLGMAIVRGNVNIFSYDLLLEVPHL